MRLHSGGEGGPPARASTRGGARAPLRPHWSPCAAAGEMRRDAARWGWYKGVRALCSSSRICSSLSQRSACATWIRSETCAFKAELPNSGHGELPRCSGHGVLPRCSDGALGYVGQPEPEEPPCGPILCGALKQMSTALFFSTSSETPSSRSRAAASRSVKPPGTEGASKTTLRRTRRQLRALRTFAAGLRGWGSSRALARTR